MSDRSSIREGPRMNPHVVPPSQHTLFMRGFHPNTEMNKIRDFFTKEGGKCSFDFFKVSQDGTRLFVALRFESKDVAKEIVSRYDNSTVIGSKITITWFKDLRRARLKAMQHGQRWSSFYGHMNNGYGRGGYMHNKFGNRMKSTVWRQQGKFHDEHRRSSSSSRSYSRSRSRSRSKSRSRSRSRSWSRSRSQERSLSPRHYRSRSSSSSRASGSDRLKKRAWKHDTGQPNEQRGPEIPGKLEDGARNVVTEEVKRDENWQPKKTDIAPPDAHAPRSPTSSEGRAASYSDSRSRSSSASSHGKERKKKKKKHRSKHRRHRRRHRHQKDSTDEEGQLSDYEEGERSPTPDHRRYGKRYRESSSSSQDSQVNKTKKTEPNKGSMLNASNLDLCVTASDSNQKQQNRTDVADIPIESDIHLNKSLRSVDAPSQVSDGMSPLHVSEGDEEGSLSYNFPKETGGALQSSSNQRAFDTNDTQLSKFSLQEELDKEDRLLTATRDSLLKEVHELATSATVDASLKTAIRTKMPSDAKTLLDRFKATMKPAGTSVIKSPVSKPTRTTLHPLRKEGKPHGMDLMSHSGAQVKSPYAHYAIRTTTRNESLIEDNNYYGPQEANLLDDSALLSRKGASGDGLYLDKDFKDTVMGARRAIRTGGLHSESSSVSIPKDKIILIRRKRAEIEAPFVNLPYFLYRVIGCWIFNIWIFATILR